MQSQCLSPALPQPHWSVCCSAVTVSLTFPAASPCWSVCCSAVPVSLTFRAASPCWSVCCSAVAVSLTFPAASPCWIARPRCSLASAFRPSCYSVVRVCQECGGSSLCEHGRRKGAPTARSNCTIRCVLECLEGAPRGCILTALSAPFPHLEGCSARVREQQRRIHHAAVAQAQRLQVAL